MEYTTNINHFDGSLDTSAAKAQVRGALAGITAPAWVVLMQALCYFIQASVHIEGMGDAVPCFGMITSCAGIYLGARLASEGSLARGLNSAALGMVALLFWIAQIAVRHIVL